MHHQACHNSLTISRAAALANLSNVLPPPPQSHMKEFADMHRPLAAEAYVAKKGDIASCSIHLGMWHPPQPRKRMLSSVTMTALAATQHLLPPTPSLMLHTCPGLQPMCNSICMTLRTPLPPRWTCPSLPLKFPTACRGCAVAKPATRLSRALSTSYSNMEATQPQICYYATAA